MQEAMISGRAHGASSEEHACCASMVYHCIASHKVSSSRAEAGNDDHVCKLVVACRDALAQQGPSIDKGMAVHMGLVDKA